jgi:4-amino-4-deoxy-L-arabinose transferase-like glycosyltransferase
MNIGDARSTEAFFSAPFTRGASRKMGYAACALLVAVAVPVKIPVAVMIPAVIMFSLVF